ncbi:hypothetical protein [Roseibium sp.]|uniref:hypothetical protein n=1 Tax=Roseibium sp. TaxID=1936156 RepID=UPI003B52D3F8
MVRPTLPAATNAKPLHFTMLAAALCVLTSAYVADRAVYWSGVVAPLFQNHRQTLVSLSIGPHPFEIPAGYFRSAQHRIAADGEVPRHQQVSLLMTWPDLKMPGDEDAPARFGEPLPLIQVNLENDPHRESLRTQLDPVYKRLARGGERTAEAGLNMLTLSGQNAKNRDIIVYDPEADDGFIARCVRKRITDKAVCHRSITPGGGLLIRYQFDQTLLPDWRRLDRAVQAKLGTFNAS